MTVTATQGFGPTNFSWLLYYSRTTISNGVTSYDSSGNIYDSSFYGLHNGIDFFADLGTDIVSTDWGVVVSASPGYNPWAAPPNSVLVRYGNHIALYGHLRTIDPGIANRERAIVQPGQKLGEVGEFNGAHLHFEMRQITDYLSDLTATAANQGLSQCELPLYIWQNFNIKSVIPDQGAYYVNPIKFFPPNLDLAALLYKRSARGVGCRADDSDCVAGVDLSKNGYPDQVDTNGDGEPELFNAWSFDVISPRRGNYWHDANSKVI